jgi:hypothetical protein
LLKTVKPAIFYYNERRRVILALLPSNSTKAQLLLEILPVPSIF